MRLAHEMARRREGRERCRKKNFSARTGSWTRRKRSGCIGSRPSFRNQVGILDTHTHHNLRQIVENRPFPNIWRAEVLEDREEYANNDHYIIQLAAKLPGFSQALARDPQIPDLEKWMALSRVFPLMEGNHVHQWLHLNLRRLFGIQPLLNEKTGERIWNLTAKAVSAPRNAPPGPSEERGPG